MGFLLRVNTAGKTSWLEQLLEALNADDKDLLSEIVTGFINLWNQLKEPLIHNCVFF